MPQNVIEIEGPEVFEHSDVWDRIALLRGNFFQSSTWSRAWWEYLEGRAELVSGLATRNGEIVGIAPMARIAFPLSRKVPLAVPVATLAGSIRGAADHLGMITEPGDDEVNRRLVEWVSRRFRGTLLIPNVPTDSIVSEVLAAKLRVVSSERCPQVRIDPGMAFDDLTAEWSKNRRKKLGQIRRRFGRMGGTTQWLDTRAQVDSHLSTVFELHEMRMADSGRSSAFTEDRDIESFHRSIARARGRQFGSWVQVASVDDQTVGALYGFRMGSTYHVYQSGWHPEWAEHSVGLVQYVAALEHVVEAGGRLFDMCRGADDYKLRLANAVSEENTYARLRGFSGAALGARYRLRGSEPSVSVEDDA